MSVFTPRYEVTIQWNTLTLEKCCEGTSYWANFVAIVEGGEVEVTDLELFLPEVTHNTLADTAENAYEDFICAAAGETWTTHGGYLCF